MQVPSWYPDDDHPLGGSFFQEQAHMLRDGGLDVGVCAVAHTHLRRWRTERGTTVRDEGGLVVVRDVVPTLPGRLQAAEPALIRRLARRALDAYERARGVPDVVHAHSVLPAIHVAAEAARRWDLPYVLTEHRPWTLQVTGARFRGIQRAVRGAAGRATVSTPFAADLATHYGTGAWDVIALPVPEPFLTVQLRDRGEGDEVVLTHVSHLTENKRPEMTMRAFAAALAQVPDARLQIVGGTTDRVAELGALARELGVADAVDLAGPRSRDEIPGLLAASDAFVLASAVEAGGTVLSEAQACGLPVVATRTWAGQFSVEPASGLLVDVDDEGALAGALVDLVRRLGDYPRHRIRQRARERFGATTFVDASRALYERALAGVDAA